MRRRDLIGLLGSAAAAWPLALSAQQTAMPVIGFLRSTSLAPFASLGVALRAGLNEAGFVEGQNVAIESRYAENQLDRLPALAAELIRHPVAVIIANRPSARAAKAATATVPIVFTLGSDPVQDGLVTSLNRPGGNVTGVTFLAAVVGSKRLELLRQFVPKATSIAVLIHPDTSETEIERNEVLGAARSLGVRIIIFDVRSDLEIEAAVASAVQRGAGAMLIGTGAFLTSKRRELVALEARHALPMIHNQREAAEAGGLMSYGTSQTEAYRQAGIYAGRILKGEKPGDLPIIQSNTLQSTSNNNPTKSLAIE